MDGATAAKDDIDEVVCPVCDHAARPWFTHPDADIYRCPSCTHAFSRLDTMRAIETYDEGYQEAHANWFSNPNQQLFRWIDEHLPADAASVLDIGCGSGAFLKFVRARRPDIRLVGIDLYFKDRIEGIEVIQGDVMTTPVPDTFATVTSLAAIEHVPDVMTFAKRLIQLCDANGSVVVMTLNGNSILYKTARVAQRLGVRVASDRLYSSHHLHHFTAKSLRRLMERVGLKVRAVHHHNAPMSALDLPASSRAVGLVLKVGVALSFAAGRLTRRCYLQTVVCRRTA
jgi:2-polyprenyl-3-methyl-5-hydroxy-6-metoxy-1,4-benzoquinol methylase